MIRAIMFEDNKQFRQNFQDYFEDSDKVFLAAAFADAENAVSQVKKHQPDLVIMDIQMPKLYGYKATAQLRQQGYTRPIIALTAHALKQERINSLNAGCDDHLTKPIDRRTLIDQVIKYVNKSSNQSSNQLLS